MSAALDAISAHVIASRVDAKSLAVAEIFPGGWHELSGDPDRFADERAGLAAVFAELKSFLARAAERNLGLVTWLN